MSPILPTEKRGNTHEDVVLKAVAFDGLKQKEKALASEIKEIGSFLKESLDTLGSEDVNTGNRHIDGVYLGKKVSVTHTARKSTSMVPDILDILEKELSEEDYKDITETVTILRDDLFEQKIIEGKISDELLSRITNVKTVYALTVKVK